MRNDSPPTDQKTLLQNAYLQIKEAKARISALENAHREPIAIIGMGCRFPGGANNPEAFWRLLRGKAECISEVPPGRWDSEEFDSLYDPDPDAPGKAYARRAGFVDQIDQFDSAFFGIAPREAVHIDPQQRLLLEVAWEALEDAGQQVHRITASRTGAFIGICNSDYAQCIFADPNNISAYTGTGTSLSVAAGRLSYVFDWRGPSIAVDTACSSSLVAVHLACQSLRNKECDMAVAGGVNLIISPLFGVVASKMRLLAADGHCKTFDAQASGTVPGEGCGVVVLKRLSDALSDDNRILALIRGSAVNQDGRSAGLTAPNGLSQQEVILCALSSAGVSPSQVTYIEAHGTGTALGDPIEVEALAEVFGQPRSNGQSSVVGSVKANIGHLAAAAGISGLIKTILSLKHQEILPQPNLAKLNPNLSLERTSLIIPTEAHPWVSNGEQRFAGISSFGWAGTNCHLVVEEAPQPPTDSHQRQEGAANRSYLVPLSAHSPEALHALVESHHQFLTGAPADNSSSDGSFSLSDLCYTVGSRRTHHNHRLAILCQSLEQLDVTLTSITQSGTHEAVILPINVNPKAPNSMGRKLAFIFSGQGGDWLGFADHLLKNAEPVFNQSLQECDELIKAEMGWSVISQLAAARSETLLKAGRTDVLQPTLFAVQVAAAAWWRHWGIEPEAVVGHSVGEVAAAHVAGILDLDVAVRVVCNRAKSMQRVIEDSSESGDMLAIRMGRKEVEEALLLSEGRVTIAAYNGEDLLVLSGEKKALEELLLSTRFKGIHYRWLNVGGAFHSRHMERVTEELAHSLSDLRLQKKRLEVYSTVYGGQCSDEQFGADYWGRNVRDAVQFHQPLDAMIKDGYELFVEVSPHPVLVSAVRQAIQRQSIHGTAIGSFRYGEDLRAAMLEGVGRLYVEGHDVKWEKIYERARGNIVSLPTYPWRRQRFWLDSDRSRKNTRHSLSRQGGNQRFSLIGRHTELAHQARNHLWEAEFDLHSFPYLGDHRIAGTSVLPGTMYLEMVLNAVRATYGEGKPALKNVNFRRALFLSETCSYHVQVMLSPKVNCEASFSVYFRQSEGEESDRSWSLYSTGEITFPDDRNDISETAIGAQLEDIRARCLEEIAGPDFYDQLSERGNQMGASFQGIKRIWRRDREALGRISIPETLRSELDNYQTHPAVLDACMQVIGAAFLVEQSKDPGRGAHWGVGVNEFRFWSAMTGFHLWSHVQLRPEREQSSTLLADVKVFDEKWRLIVEVLGVRLHHATAEIRHFGNRKLNDYLYEIQWRPQARSDRGRINSASVYLRSPAKITEHIGPRVT